MNTLLLNKNIEKDFEALKNCLNRGKNYTHGMAQDKSFCEFIYDSLPYLQYDERPDAFAVIDNTLLLMEHFTFDNSQIIENAGLNLRRQQKITKINLDRKLDAMSFHSYNKFQARGVVVEYENIKASSEFYIENFKKQFIKHANKIEEYKKEITSKINASYNKILVGFIVEEVGSFGSFFRENHKIFYVDLINTKEFLDLFEAQKNLDFVIFAPSLENGVKFQSFISRNSIKKVREYQYELKSRNLDSSITTVIGADFKIPIAKSNQTK